MESVLVHLLLYSYEEQKLNNMETFDFIKSLELDKVQIGIATPFPGTEIWNDGIKLGKIVTNQWSEDYDVMFHVNPGIKANVVLQGKKLLTQIEGKKFNE